ncbi:hypothetical protein BDZ89DRAFT_1076024 [Hymenopellis radicata]|nr:hypothetical protein BDZ89DRAFT_1076024 [Hymenopellis radicata]
MAVPNAIFRALHGTLDAPDIKTNPKGWWTAMDNHTIKRYSPDASLPSHPHRNQRNAYYDNLLNEDVLLECVSTRRITASSQLQYSPEDAFEDQWTVLTPEEQEKHFLEAFAVNERSSNYLQFTLGKADCPELNRDVLFADNGGGFIELMGRCVLPDNNVVPAQPMIVESERFDNIIEYKENDTIKTRAAVCMMARMTRTAYIVNFVFATLASVKGHTITYQVFTTEHSKTKSTLKAHSQMIDAIMGGKSAGKAFRKAEAKRRKDMGLFCQHCLKAEEKEKNGKMTVCSRCRKLGREIRYCGRDCQLADWKQHKLQCGKPLDASLVLDDVYVQGSERIIGGRPDIPPCPPGHRRSPHVIRLIEDLETCPLKDYLTEFTALDFGSAALDEVPGAAVFMHMRNILFTSTGPGAEGALMYVYRVLQNFSDERRLQQQLQREYGMDLWKRMKAMVKTAPGPMYWAPDVSRADMEEMIGHLKGTPRFTEELAGYTKGQGDIMMLGITVGPNKDVAAKVEFPREAAPAAASLLPSNTKKAVGANAKGPNFCIPDPEDHPEDGFIHANYCNLGDQIKYLQMNPEADYMIWGHPSSPNLPMALNFFQKEDVLGFIHHRYCLFRYGPFNIDSLAYIFMALRPVLQRKKIPEAVLLRQLEREYSAGYVKIARAQIYRREDGKEVYKRRLDGKEYELARIPAKKDVLVEVMYQVAESGRFEEFGMVKRGILDHFKA